MIKQTPFKTLKARVGGVTAELSGSHNMEQNPPSIPATSFHKRNTLEVAWLSDSTHLLSTLNLKAADGGLTWLIKYSNHAFNSCFLPRSSLFHYTIWALLRFTPNTGQIKSIPPVVAPFRHWLNHGVMKRELKHLQCWASYFCLPLPSCRNVMSFLTTGKSGMIGGCMLWLLRMLRYFAMFRDGSKRSWRSLRCFSYLLGSFSHVPLRRATGARFNPLEGREIPLLAWRTSSPWTLLWPRRPLVSGVGHEEECSQSAAQGRFSTLSSLPKWGHS